MKFDIFFSICQTEVDGYMPTEAQMLHNFFDQVKLSDELGFGTAWVAETHLSCQTQKENPSAVIPHFKGEIGLNTDILQLATRIFAITKNIGVGSAIRNIICNGGPLAHAEAIKTFLMYHDLTPNENRKLNIGFAAGRFPFSNEPYGYIPRDQVEKIAWPVVKGKIFREATEIFLRGLRGDKFSSSDLNPQFLEERDFRTKDHWQQTLDAYVEQSGEKVERIPLASRWSFPKVGIIPFEASLKNLNLIIGSHDPVAQKLANDFLPCGVFNLSITPAETIEKTHEMMNEVYHKDGGAWSRDKMPRTALVFINGDKSLTEAEQSQRARNFAKNAVENYWKAMEGTLDPDKVAGAVENAIAGNPKEVIEQMKQKYHADDRLMLWFDFSCHDNEFIKQSMRCFMEEVAPKL